MSGTVFWGDSLVAGLINDTDRLLFKQHNVADLGLSGDTAPQILARYQQSPNRCYDQWNHVIWAGQNHIDTASLVNSVASMVSAISATHTRFLVVSVINAGMTGVDQGPAGARYLEKMAANTSMRSTYGAKFLDLHRMLVDYGKSISDVQSLSFDAPPSTFQPVDIHLTGPNGYTFCTLAILNKLQSLGYLTRSVTNAQIVAAGGAA